MKSSCLKLYWLSAPTSIYRLLLSTGVSLICGVPNLLEYVASTARRVFLVAIPHNWLGWFLQASCWTTKCLHGGHGEMNLFWLHCIVMRLLAVIAQRVTCNSISDIILLLLLFFLVLTFFICHFDFHFMTLTSVLSSTAHNLVSSLVFFVFLLLQENVVFLHFVNLFD